MKEKGLTGEQIVILNEFGNKYLEWLKTSKGEQNLLDHINHRDYLKKKLSKESILKLKEDDFRDFIKFLWASNVWGNKDWYIDNRILQPNNDLENILTELNKLLFDSNEIETRYDDFRANIKGLGPAYLTEILHFMFPEKYCLWNEKPKNVLPFLKLNNLLPERIFKYGIKNGGDYIIILENLEIILKSLNKLGLKNFLDLDMFFWFIYDEILPKIKENEIKTSEQDEEIVLETGIIDSHEGAGYYLLEIGKMLGYSTYTPDKSKIFQGTPLSESALLDQIPYFAPDSILDTIKYIDVIWFDDEENPTHCFEVEHSTDFVTGLARLLQLKPYSTELYIVAQKEKKFKFDKLINSRIQYKKLMKRFHFISYEDLIKLYERTKPFYDTKKKILGS